MKTTNEKRTRNGRLIDWWSLVHFVVSALLATLINPVWALIITAAWEPLEIFIISPMLAKINVDFGYETLRNSISDILFNTLGVLAAIFFLN